MADIDLNELRTPPDLYRGLNLEFDFTLDACATHENAMCERYFTKENDGLAQSWRGERVFMNPPYGRRLLSPWPRKAYYETLWPETLVVALLPARTEQPWWHDYCLSYRVEHRWLRKRLVHIRPDGTVQGSGKFPSAIVVWRPR